MGIRDIMNKFMGRGSFSTACVGIKCLISWVKDMFTICAGVRVSYLIMDCVGVRNSCFMGFAGVRVSFMVGICEILGVRGTSSWFRNMCMAWIMDCVGVRNS